MLEQTNPGIVTDFELDDNGRFKFCFFSYGACIHGFRSQIRPSIAIDDTHLKGSFRSILFVITCSDGNEQVYPFAFGIGHKENRESWTWFLRRVRKCIDCPTDCMFIYDQHKGIKKAMRIVYPDAPHGLFVFHLSMNLKNTFKMEDVIGIFKRVYQIYREFEFNEEMSELMRVHLNAYNNLMTIGLARWSHAYSPFPIIVLLEYILDMMHKWFHDRQTFVDSLHTQLTPWETKYLMERNEESILYTDLYVLRIRNHLLPCAHALATLRACKRLFIDFYSHYYKKSSLVEAYAGVIQPVGHMGDWEIHDEISLLVVHPPEWMSQAGRPCKIRKPSKGEFRSRKAKTCSICKQAGHIRQNCPNPLGLLTVDNIVEHEPGPSSGLSQR
ncbi:hypothetical protein Dsin_016601 [Dipteronia sinensis]|uniref:CCHC-type domain-containing protein n=1 Tax=Dipteronia sinensis TaxID=43782 RepID=A0AAE0E655_9ROSI|nr:hypothetical protein Dsin_016601 [Dipteronia sinensis]